MTLHVCWSCFFGLDISTLLFTSADLTSLLCFSTLLTWHLYSAFQLIFQKWPGNLVFSTFWLRNVLRATAACDVWTSELQKLFRPHGVLCISTCQCASRHFCAFWLANVLRATAACHFSSVCWTATSAPAALARLLFEHQDPRIIEKTQRFAASQTFGAPVAVF